MAPVKIDVKFYSVTDPPAKSLRFMPTHNTPRPSILMEEETKLIKDGLRLKGDVYKYIWRNLPIPPEANLAIIEIRHFQSYGTLEYLFHKENEFDIPTGKKINIKPCYDMILIPLSPKRPPDSCLSYEFNTGIFKKNNTTCVIV